MIVYRLSKAKYARDLSGKGAMLAGGRWNSRGVPLVYASSSRALCLVEIAVHTPLGIVPADYMIVTIALPEQRILPLEADQLPADWNAIPHADSTQMIGDQFASEGAHLVLQVPSVVVADEYNYLLNPVHPLSKQVRVVSVEPFPLDQRLFK